MYICSASADIDVADGILTGVESADDFLYNTYYRESATVTDTPTTEATTTIAPATNIPATEAPEGGESTPATGSFAGYVFAAAIVSLITIAFISKKRLKA